VEDNIEMYIKDLGWDNWKWMEMDKDRVQRTLCYLRCWTFVVFHWACPIRKITKHNEVYKLDITKNIVSC